MFANNNTEPKQGHFLASSKIAMPTILFEQVGRFDSNLNVASEDRELCDSRFLLGA
jgi:hypothetical protein